MQSGGGQIVPQCADSDTVYPQCGS